jgi:hypothetical protein
VLKETRSRLLGPSTVNHLVEALPTEVDGTAADGCIQAVGAVVVAGGDCHPNLMHLIDVLARRWQRQTDAISHGRQIFLNDLAAADYSAQALAIQGLALAVAVDGRLGMRERALIRKAYETVGQPLDMTPFRQLAAAFVSGEEVDSTVLVALGDSLMAGAESSAQH